MEGLASSPEEEDSLLLDVGGDRDPLSSSSSELRARPREYGEGRESSLPDDPEDEPRDRDLRGVLDLERLALEWFPGESCP